MLVTGASDDLHSLRRAIERKDLVKIATLLAGNKELATMRSPDGQGPAWWAMAAGGEPRVVGLLLSSGMQLATNLTDAAGRTPLETFSGPLDEKLILSWTDEAERARPVLDVLRLKLISTLEHRLVSRVALADELDALDD